MQTKVLNGLPVTIEYNWSSGDPSVGIAAGVEEWWITHISGKPTQKPDWIYSRLSEAESNRIMSECDADANAPVEYDGDDWDD